MNYDDEKKKKGNNNKDGKNNKGSQFENAVKRPIKVPKLRNGGATGNGSIIRDAQASNARRRRTPRGY